MQALLLSIFLTLGGAAAVQAHDYVEVVHVKHQVCHGHRCHKYHKKHRIKRIYIAHPPCYHCGPCCGPRVHVVPTFGFGFFVHPRPCCPCH